MNKITRWRVAITTSLMSRLTPRSTLFQFSRNNISPKRNKMQRYLPPDAKRREIIEAKKVKRTGPLAKFVDLHDPSLLDDTKIRFAHNTSSLKIPNENSAQKSR